MLLVPGFLGQFLLFSLSLAQAESLTTLAVPPPAGGSHSCLPPSWWEVASNSHFQSWCSGRSQRPCPGRPVTSAGQALAFQQLWWVLLSHPHSLMSSEVKLSTHLQSKARSANRQEYRLQNQTVSFSANLINEVHVSPAFPGKSSPQLCEASLCFSVTSPFWPAWGGSGLVRSGSRWRREAVPPRRWWRARNVSRTRI